MAAGNLQVNLIDSKTNLVLTSRVSEVLTKLTFKNIWTLYWLYLHDACTKTSPIDSKCPLFTSQGSQISNQLTSMIIPGDCYLHDAS